MGVVVAHEALAKRWSPAHSNALSFFAPNINIVRDVRWGRAQETYAGFYCDLNNVAWIPWLSCCGLDTVAPL